MALIRRVEGQPNTLLLKCPGCSSYHQIWIGEGSGPRWSFNGDFEKPTFSPSLLVWWDEPTNIDNPDAMKADLEAKRLHGTPLPITKEVCHSFIVDGVWQFLYDCTHALAGQHVPMIDV